MKAQTGPGAARRYELLPMDTARWDGFAHRPGDVLICTSYKAGTTWMQMICALLVFGRAELPASLSELSPWVERRGTPVSEVHARLAAQTHRRFIKSHSPLDALPWRDDALYLYSGRDPRDVFMSMQNHMANAHPEFIGRMAQEALAAGALPSPDAGLQPELPED